MNGNNIDRIIAREQEANQLGKAGRKRLREILHENDSDGGYLARGFTGLFKYWEAVFTEYGKLYISQQNSMAQYESLLGIPLGAYPVQAFTGMRNEPFFVFTEDLTIESAQERTWYKRVSCDLQVAGQIRVTWKAIKDFYGLGEKDLPTTDQIRSYLESDVTHKAKKTQARGRKINLESPVSDRQHRKYLGRIDELLGQVAELRRELEAERNYNLSKEVIHPTTRQYISRITSENQELKDKLARAETRAESRQRQKVSI